MSNGERDSMREVLTWRVLFLMEDGFDGKSIYRALSAKSDSLLAEKYNAILMSLTYRTKERLAFYTKAFAPEAEACLRRYKKLVAGYIDHQRSVGTKDSEMIACTQECHWFNTLLVDKIKTERMWRNRTKDRLYKMSLVLDKDFSLDMRV